VRCITYAGETVLTTDDVAEALVTLTASVASFGEAEAVKIPIVREDNGDADTADMVIGVGNDVLSAPTEWEGEEPNFSDSAERLRSHRHYPRPRDESDDNVTPLASKWEPDENSGIDYI
jgi:hypothetical protein